MTVARAASETLTQLLARVRREVGDPSADATGNTIPPAGRRYSDSSDILPAINDTLIKMGTIMAIKHSGDALAFTDLAYTEEADEYGMDLPSGINQEGVVMVSDVTVENSPIELFYLSPQEMLGVPVSNTSQFPITRRFYTLGAEGTGGQTWRIIIHPNATGRTFRIYWVAPPFISDGTGADTPLLSIRWRELIGLGAARQLLSVDEEVPEKLEERYLEELKTFREFCSRQKRPARVRMARRIY